MEMTELNITKSINELRCLFQNQRASRWISSECVYTEFQAGGSQSWELQWSNYFQPFPLSDPEYQDGCHKINRPLL